MKSCQDDVKLQNTAGKYYETTILLILVCFFQYETPLTTRRLVVTKFEFEFQIWLQNLNFKYGYKIWIWSFGAWKEEGL